MIAKALILLDVHKWHGQGRQIEKQVDTAGQEILHREIEAAIRDEIKLSPAEFLEQKTRKMGRTSKTCGSLACLVGVGPQPIDQLLQVFCWQIIPANDHHRLMCHQANWREIRNNVEGKPLA